MHNGRQFTKVFVTEDTPRFLEHLLISGDTAPQPVSHGGPHGCEDGRFWLSVRRSRLQRYCRAADGIHRRLAHVVGRQPVDDGPVALTGSKAEHALAQRRDFGLERANAIVAIGQRGGDIVGGDRKSVV